MELETVKGTYYRVKRGQGVREIAEAFSVPARRLAAENNLIEEAEEGWILKIPPAEFNLYTVSAGDGKTLLCGSEENFYKKNKTKHLYPMQTVFL